MRLLTRFLSLALTILFLWLALSKVDLTAFADELRAVDYRWLIPAALCTLLGYFVRTVRWQVILSGAARAPLRTLFPILIMGFATNNVLPGRLGEFWRAYLLGRKRGVRKSLALASVFVERVFDGMTLIFILGIVSMNIQLPGWGRQIEMLAAFVFLGAATAIALVLSRPTQMLMIMSIMLRPLPKRWSTWGGERVEAFVEGLLPLRRRKVLVSAAILSIVVWVCEGASYFLLSRGMNLGLAPGMVLPGLGLALVTINLGIMIPSGPGYVGTQEYFGTSALEAVGVTAQSALALVLVSHVVQYVLITGLGLVFFAREQVFPRDVRPTLAEEAAA